MLDEVKPVVETEPHTQTQSHDDGPEKYIKYEGQAPVVEKVVEEVAKPAETQQKPVIDKDLQQIQQQTAAMQKQLADFIAAKSPEAKEVAKAALEKSQKRFEAMVKITGTKTEDIDPFQSVKEMATETHAAFNETDAKQQQLAERLAQVEQTQRQLEADRRATKFERAHPELSGKYEEIAAKAAEETNNFFGEDAAKIPDGAWGKIASANMERLIAAEKAKVAPEAKAPPAPKKPAGSTSPVVSGGSQPDSKPSVVKAFEDANARFIKFL